jgi:biotin carboxyl carrier protein
MYRVDINGNKLEVNSSGDTLLIYKDPLLWDIVQISDGYYHVIHEHRGYRMEVVKSDSSTRSFTIKVNGHTYVLELKDKFDLLLEKMGMNNGAANKVITIKAPMPGLIIDLKIKVGDPVKTGDQLLILEAMKMENIIKSPGEGVVKSVLVKKGDSVEKGQVLIQF